MADPVLLEFREGPNRGVIAVVTLNRPEQHNAINPALGKKLSEVFKSVR